MQLLTIPPGVPFLECLAEAIFHGRIPAGIEAAPDPLTLSKFSLFLPTRRACRAAQSAFLDAAPTSATTLPQIRPIGDFDEEEIIVAGSAMPTQMWPSSGRSDGPGAGLNELLRLPNAVPELERRLVLTELVLAWSRRRRDAACCETEQNGAYRLVPPLKSPAQACQLAGQLAQLMDLVETEQKSFDGLGELVPESMSAHWQETLDFLQIVTDYWPRHMQERGLLSPANRRNAVLQAQAALLNSARPQDPVIVAGVTGSIPATATFMRQVLEQAKGVVVLPGLDLELSEAAWAQLTPDHPQHAFKNLLDRLAMDRAEVSPLYPAGESMTIGGGAWAGIDTRNRIVSDAMLPAEDTGAWLTQNKRDERAAIFDALERVALLEADSAEEEAEIISLIMRHSVEQPTARCALVTPDRNLARRVSIRLAAWGLNVDDSAGRPLSKSPPGTLFELALKAWKEEFSPSSTMALLKHPLVRLGFGVGEVRATARALELAVFRKLYLRSGLDGIEAGFADAISSQESNGEQANGGEDGEKIARIKQLIARLRAAYAPLDRLRESGEAAALRELARAHIDCCQQLATDENGTFDRLWAGEAGQALQTFFVSLLDETIHQAQFAALDYGEIYQGLVSGQVMRSSRALHPRLYIWGPLEARLQHVETAILAGLNDGTWPEVADPGPWLNRPMREALNLPAPEQRIGFSAHDFCQLLGAPKVYLTRSKKVDGVPTVPSRWLLRLRTCLQARGLRAALEPAETEPAWRYLANLRNDFAMREGISAPAPRPPLASRPRRLSVTGVERLLANPYGVYARYILGLRELPALEQDPDAALRGQVLHNVLYRFSQDWPVELPENVEEEIVRSARLYFKEHAAHPRIGALWLPRLRRFAAWFAQSEPARRGAVRRTHGELTGKLELDLPGGTFVLTARADRIDDMGDGARIYDYKTGNSPEVKRVVSGLAPQLPLEAAIAEAGGFAELGRRRTERLAYISASGGEPPGEENWIKTDDMEQMIERVKQLAIRVLAQFDDESTPYRALRRPEFAAAYRYDEYAHLARVDEWSGRPRTASDVRGE